MISVLLRTPGWGRLGWCISIPSPGSAAACVLRRVSWYFLSHAGAHQHEEARAISQMHAAADSWLRHFAALRADPQKYHKELPSDFSQLLAGGNCGSSAHFKLFSTTYSVAAFLHNPFILLHHHCITVLCRMPWCNTISLQRDATVG